MKDVARRLLGKNHLVVTAFFDGPSSASPFFSEIRRIKPNIPILYMPSERGKSPEEITCLLESVMDTVGLDRP